MITLSRAGNASYLHICAWSPASPSAQLRASCNAGTHYVFVEWPCWVSAGGPVPDELAIILCKTESHQKIHQEPLTTMGKWCPRGGKLRAMASLSGTGKWYPDQMRKSLGNSWPGYSWKYFPCHSPLINQLILFPKQTFLRGRWWVVWAKCLYYLLYVINNLKTHAPTSSYFYLLTIPWVRNSDMDKPSSSSPCSIDWVQLLSGCQGSAFSGWPNWAGSSRRLHTHIWPLSASWWPHGQLGLHSSTLVSGNHTSHMDVGFWEGVSRAVKVEAAELLGSGLRTQSLLPHSIS